MENKFTAHYRIDYQDINEDLSTSFIRLMQYLQETSLLHSLQAGYHMKWFAEHNRGFIITNWDIEVYQYPKWGDEISVGTWPTKFKGIIGERAFHMADAQGEPILNAHSNWVYTDLERHRPVKVPEEMKENYGAIYPKSLEGSFAIQDAGGSPPVNSEELIIRRGDIDSNHHVNNIRYIQWAIEHIPEQIYNERVIKRLKASYKKECRIGNTIHIATHRDAQDEHIFTTAINSADETNTHAIIYSVWA